MKRSGYRFWVVLCVLCGAPYAGAERGGAVADAEAVVHRQRAGLEEMLAWMAGRTQLFPARRLEKARILALESRLEVRRVWVSAYDRLLVLDGVAQSFTRLRRGDAAFQLHHAASLAHYRFSLDFIERFERDPGLDAVLNEADPALGLPAHSYTALKNRILNVTRAGSFASKRLVDRVVFGVASSALEAAIEADSAQIWEMGRGTGPRLTGTHLANRAGRAGADAALPVQEGVARRMAEVRVRRGEGALISDAQISRLRTELQPGDILLTRREWFVSNVGIPGFWSHTALYVGTAQERRAFFSTPATQRWVKQQGEASGDFETLLVATRAESLLRASALGTPPARVLEAIAEGVAFTTLERAAHADSIAVLRPALGRDRKARAVWRAFFYAGRPYDYNFDFRSDDALVCSELVYKAYRELPGEVGLELPLGSALGRPMMTPNELARIYAEEGDRRFELVAFLDGDERAGLAQRSDAAVFRTTWFRPKWHILLGPADPGAAPAAKNGPPPRGESKR